MKKKILLGNEAIVQGAMESGVQFVSTFPGTPASEIGNTFFKMSQNKEFKGYFEFSVNEKIYGRVELKNNSLLWFLTTGFNIKKQNKDFKICPNSDINENELEFKYQRIQKLNKILKLII